MIAETGRIGFMGGTYDPPHHGHIHLALSLAEAHGLDEIWICPAWTNPHKQGENGQSATHRLAMARLTFDLLPSFRILDLECQTPTVSYTIDTLRTLHAQEQLRTHPRQLFLLIGEDCANSLHTWREPESLLDLATPLVGARSAKHSPAPQASVPPRINAAIQAGWTPIPLLDISSTTLRQRLQAGLYCKHLMAPKVGDYICRNEVY